MGEPRPFQRSERVIRIFELAGLWLGGTAMVLMMVVVAVDALMRYAFNAPLQWTYDAVAQYLLVAASVLGLSATFTNGDHIRIDLISLMLPRRARIVIEVAMSLLSFAVILGISYTSVKLTWHAWSHNEFIPGYVKWPLWLGYGLVAAGAVLFSIRLAYYTVTLPWTGELVEDKHTL